MGQHYVREEMCVVPKDASKGRNNSILLDLDEMAMKGEV
jgi:hypothetical protein